MEEQYDVIILGTGIKECILSGLLSSDGKKVLHIDRNSYYGAETASLNLKELYSAYKPDAEVKSELGDHRDFIVDLCPKFLMACGNLVKMLIHTKVTRYLNFKGVDATYVYKGGKLYKMPATPAEALSSNLIGFFQKRKLRNFLIFAQNFEINDKNTHEGLKNTVRELYGHFGLDENSAHSVSHALALQLDDSHLDDPAAVVPFLQSIKLYNESLQRYGDSPFIYPIYSLSGLPEGFARLSAVHGGVYMLNRPVDEILFDAATGRVAGISSQGQKAYCRALIGDPTYFAADASAVAARVARCVFVLRRPPLGAEGARSAQIIVPGASVGRRGDIYVAVLSAQHRVAPKGAFVAIASALAETQNPRAELGCVRALMGDVAEEFYFETELRRPTAEFEARGDGTFMAASNDATTHFESMAREVMALYERVAGKRLELSGTGMRAGGDGGNEGGDGVAV